MKGFRSLAERFNKCGQIAKDHGIKFAYHNHAYSFQEIDGIFLQDVLMNNTNKDLVDFEMDIYWVVAAGQDPIEWFENIQADLPIAMLKITSLYRETSMSPALLEEVQSILLKY